MKHRNPEIESRLQTLAGAGMPTIQMGLSRIEKLLELVGNPQHDLPPVVHVAGTNGKGSLLAYLRAMLETAGYRVHRYTSPHLVRFNERILLAGHDIDDELLLDLLRRVEPVCKSCPATYFEATTALAFLAYREVKADILLLETGLGGRQDATNIFPAPMLTAITPVSLDHMEFLGNKVGLIAAEKAGILKAGVPCIVGPQELDALAAIESRAQELAAPLLRCGKEWNVSHQGARLTYEAAGKSVSYPLPALPGEHQIINAGIAIACANSLKDFNLSYDHIAQGLKNAQWPARLEPITQGKLAALVPASHELWLDGGHNESAAHELARWIAGQAKPVHLICGMLATKDSTAFLRILAPHIRSLAAVEIEGDQVSRKAAELADIAKSIGLNAAPAPSLKEAIKQQVQAARAPSIILICGSLMLAGDVLGQNEG